ncbi:MAG: hypothetical protein ACKVWV_08950 [Planctomycetota bacterium]
MKAAHTRARIAHGPALGAAAVALWLSGCAGFVHWPWTSTQRWPGPMETTSDPLPKGDAVAAPTGAEEVLVVRHADPVQVRPAGLTSSFPLTFYNKSIRVMAGGAVYSAPGGRAEVLWADGSSVVLFGRGTGIVGSESRGEPAFSFREVERASLELKRETHIELLGGAELAAHSGPFVLDHVRPGILRVKNQSKATGEIHFREARIALDPGQGVDLPILSAGSTPVAQSAGLSVARAGGVRVEYGGEIDLLDGATGVGLRARGEHEIRGQGVSVQLAPGEVARFHALGGAPAPAADAVPAPLPAPPEAAPVPTGSRP